MAEGGSTRIGLVALACNALVAVAKFAASAATGSSAMFSEAVHSTVDTGNQALLLYGLRRAKRPPDDTHPFGYAKEIYFWSFTAAILIFSIGAGLAIYAGIQKILYPEEMRLVYINYIVLGVAIVFEATALWVAVVEFNERRGTKPIFRAIRDSKDPSLISVLLEDVAAMAGLLIALTGIALAHILDMPALDGAAAIAIGGILALTALALALKSKSLLIGEAAAPHIVEGVRRLVSAQPGIVHIHDVLTMQLGPGDVLVNVSVDFQDAADAATVEKTVGELERLIKAHHPEVSRLFIDVRSRQDYERNARPAP